MILKCARLVFFLFFLLAGTLPAVRTDRPGFCCPARKEKLSTFEKSFKPSEYDTDIDLVHKKENQPRPIVDVTRRDVHHR